MTAVETSPAVTGDTSNNNKAAAGPDVDTEFTATQARAHVRARDSVPDAPIGGYGGLPRLWLGEGQATFRRVAGWLEGNALLKEHPPSFASRFAYARAAPMAGHSRFLRKVQQVDAYLIGTLGVAVCYALAWIWDRPLRRYVAITVAALVWLLR